MKISYRVEFAPRRKLVAVCNCGWRSASVSSGGLAGALFDRHKEETH